MSQEPLDPADKRRARATVIRDGVFVSYRRSDSQEAVGRLADDLRDYFGTGHVYRDIDSNRSAQDYTIQIDEALRRSKVVLAVIGPTWLDSPTESGSSRLWEPDDLVRIELERAFSAGIVVIPVLVRGSKPLSVGELPESLATLGRLQVCRMRDDDWQYDLGRIFETLEHHGVVPRPNSNDNSAVEVKAALVTRRHYERTLQA